MHRMNRAARVYSIYQASKQAEARSEWVEWVANHPDDDLLLTTIKELAR
jgi:hypothetical protein